MGSYLKIIGQCGVVVEISSSQITRNLYATGNRICFFNGTIIAEYDTYERTAEVWENLKQAALEGSETFTVPKE